MSTPGGQAVAARERERQRQQGLVQALQAGSRGVESEALDGLLRGPAARRARGLAAHAAHAGALAEKSLASNFPTVRALVGGEAFAALARDFRERHPAERGDVFWLGAGLPGFIDGNPQLADLPYLADCARLDWLVACAEIAEDAAFEPDTLGLLAEASPAALRLELQPGTALLESRFCVASIRAAHAADAAPDAFDLARERLARGQGERVLVWRAGWRGRTRALEPGDVAFLRALLDGRSLGAALDAAVPAGFDFAAWLVRALEAGWLRRARLVSSGAAGEAAP